MKASRIAITGAAALAACTVLGMAPPAVQASAGNLIPAWTRQNRGPHPSARVAASMAYDAATSTAVLFGGGFGTTGFSDTWTWNGSTWTKQAPATRPPGLIGASMAYDAATGTAVLFGGYTEYPPGYRNGTWAWNGSTWTKQAPATSPPPMTGTSMAYDAATGTVVLFGGLTASGGLGGTWTWNGSTWTQQNPATSPPERYGASMAYDEATGTAVLFGGNAGSEEPLSDTWTWNGTTWTQQAPAAHPPGLTGASMAYDEATGTAVLFGGLSGPGHHRTGFRNGTWTWNGTTWTKNLSSGARPHGREYAAMAYDAATGTLVLFGGEDYIIGIGPTWRADTWTWG